MADDVDVPDLGECGIQELELSPTRGRVCGSFNEVDRRNGLSMKKSSRRDVWG